ncbi:hypothetical protein C8R45DRAFT_1167485 [Mycena sanguinolenta]|nr:hypothetical protein C8R45DRAFT_1167485 [Mycena sanguinolenta]
MAATVPTNINPTDAPPFTLAAPPLRVPPVAVGLAPPPEPAPAALEDPPLPPPDPLVATAPTVVNGKAVPVKVVWNPDGPSTQTAPPLPSSAQLSLTASSRHTEAPWTMGDRRVTVVVSPLIPTASSMKYVVALSADSTPPTLTVAKAVTETLLRDSDVVVGAD